MALLAQMLSVAFALSPTQMKNVTIAINLARR